MKQDKLMIALECCSKGGRCAASCPYDDDSDDIGKCTSDMARDALALIKTLQKQNERLKRRLNAAIHDLRFVSHCRTCKHFRENGGACTGLQVCRVPARPGWEYNGPWYEWRGPCAENGGAE